MIQTIRRCNRCLVEKPLDQFYKKLDGRASLCAECSRKAKNSASRTDLIPSARTQNLIGQKFNRLTVKGFNRTTGHRTYWDCTCDCGTEVTVRADQLKRGTTLSCGCYAQEARERPRLPNEEAFCRSLLSHYRTSAKGRGLEFNLTVEDIHEFSFKDCSYCGEPPSMELRIRKAGLLRKYNSLDRADSDKGYIKGNIRTACKFCNWAKVDYTVDEFLAWIKRVYEYQARQGRSKQTQQGREARAAGSSPGETEEAA